MNNTDKELLKKIYNHIVDNDIYYLRDVDVKVLYQLFILKDVQKVKKYFLYYSLQSTIFTPIEEEEQLSNRLQESLMLLEILNLIDNKYKPTF